MHQDGGKWKRRTSKGICKGFFDKVPHKLLRRRISDEQYL